MPAKISRRVRGAKVLHDWWGDDDLPATPRKMAQDRKLIKEEIYKEWKSFGVNLFGQKDPSTGARIPGTANPEAAQANVKAMKGLATRINDINRYLKNLKR